MNLVVLITTLDLSQIGESSWRWLTGEPFVYEAWGDNACPAGPYPNDAPGSTHAYVVNRAECGQIWDDGSNGANHSGDFMIEWSADCNNDGVVDYGQILDGTFADEDQNGVPDCCDQGVPCSSPAGEDCNGNGVLDSCELEDNDCNSNNIPDDCEGFEDCNANGIGDVCDIASGASQDINQMVCPTSASALPTLSPMAWWTSKRSLVS